MDITVLNHDGEPVETITYSTRPVADKYDLAAEAVLTNLLGRSGVGNELENVDDEIRVEIASDLSNIIRHNVSRTEEGNNG